MNGTRWISSMRVALGWALLSLAFVPQGTGGDYLPGEDEPDAEFAYHLRVVRVSRAGADPGAALGWAQNGGTPVVLPDDEAWGSPLQLEGLARALGGDRADAVTGFFVLAESAAVQFARTVYLEDETVELTFEGTPPTEAGGTHELYMRLASLDRTEAPLAETRVLMTTDRTLAIAAPSPLENDWLVLAVTVVGQTTAVEGIRRVGAIHTVEGDAIEPPRFLEKIAPRYPEAARRNRVEGYVALQMVVDADGIPRAPAVHSMSEGSEELAAAAVDAVQRWRCAPAMLDGEPVAVWMTVSVQFRLE